MGKWRRLEKIHKKQTKQTGIIDVLESISSIKTCNMISIRNKTKLHKCIHTHLIYVLTLLIP